MENKRDWIKTVLTIGAIAALAVLAVLLIKAPGEKPVGTSPEKEAIIEHLLDDWAPGGP